MRKRVILRHCATAIATLYLACAIVVLIRTYVYQDIWFIQRTSTRTLGITSKPGALILCYIRDPFPRGFQAIIALTPEYNVRVAPYPGDDHPPVPVVFPEYYVKPAHRQSDGTLPDIGTLNLWCEPLGMSHANGVFFGPRSLSDTPTCVLDGRAVCEAWGGFEFWRVFNPRLDDPKTGLATTRLWVVPAWMLLAPPLVPLGLAMRRWVMRRRSRRAGEPGAVPCRVCGYDLRATPNRCPECGTIVKP